MNEKGHPPGNPQLALIASSPTGHAVRRLAEAAAARGVATVFYDTFGLQAHLGGEGLALSHLGQPVLTPSHALLRVGLSSQTQGLMLARHLAAMGVKLDNPPQSMALASDKFASLVALSAAGLPVPPTVLVRDPAHLQAPNPVTGRFPVVVKLTHQSQGVGVMLAESRAALQSLMDTLWLLHQPVLVQRFYPEAAGQDTRLMVVGGEVVAAVIRTAPEGDFRSNLHRGGRAVAHTPTPPEVFLALKATRALGLDTAGVDLLNTHDGPVVLEVNAFAGFEGLERATGVDVAGLMVARLISPSSCGGR